MSLSTVERAEQAAACYTHRLAGKTIREIAVEVGISTATVQNRINSHIESKVGPDAEAYRQVTVDRLERLLTKAEVLMGPTHKPEIQLKAQDQARKVTLDLFDVMGLRVLKVDVKDVTETDTKSTEDVVKFYESLLFGDKDASTATI